MGNALTARADNKTIILNDGLVKMTLEFSSKTSLENALAASFKAINDEYESVCKERINLSLSSKISALNLNSRPRGALWGAGINYVSELVVMTSGDLLKIQGFGKRSLGEVNDALYGLGLHLAMDISQFTLD